MNFGAQHTFNRTWAPAAAALGLVVVVSWLRNQSRHDDCTRPGPAVGRTQHR